MWSEQYQWKRYCWFGHGYSENRKAWVRCFKWKKKLWDHSRKGLEIDPEPGFPTEGEAIFRRTTTPVVEHFYNQWNILRIKCVKNEISVWLNGVFVNKAINCRTKSGTPVALGHITLQSEIDNVVFRNILLQTLD